jgi:hypothetical protein
MNTEILEERGGHVRKKCFQVIAVTPEHKLAEVRKCDLNCDRRMRQLALDLTIGCRGYKANLELLQVRLERNRSEKKFWLDVCGCMVASKKECDEANGTCKKRRSDWTCKVIQPEVA